MVKRPKRLTTLVLCGVTLIASGGAQPARAIDKGWDLLLPTVVRHPDQNSASVLAYDRERGIGQFLAFSKQGFARGWPTMSWRKDWDTIAVYGTGIADFVFFYTRETGYARIWQIDRNIGLKKNIEDLSGLTKTWDIIAPLNYRSQAALLFYSRTDGSVVINAIDDRRGALGRRTAGSSGWRKTWDIITPVNRQGTNYVLLYDRAAGAGAIYPVTKDLTLGRRTYQGNSWRKTWHSIVPFDGKLAPFHKQKSFVFFYDNRAGEMNIHEFTQDGQLGARVQSRSGLRKTWDEILVYVHYGERLLLFYDKESGDINVYELTADGKMGTKRQ